MSTITKPSPIIDPDQRAAEAELLIVEARAHAHRRRWRYGLAAVLVAAGLLAGFFGRFPPPPSGSSGSPAHHSALAPVNQSEPSRVLAADAVRYVGYVIVYDDGRVIGSPGMELIEGQLTAAGLELVRTGGVQVMDLMFEASALPDNVWAEFPVRPYVPAHYAACFDGPGTDPAGPGGRRLPVAVQALLNGKEHTYGNVNLLGGPDRGAASQGAVCAELNPVEAAVLRRTLQSAGFANFDLGGPEVISWAMTCGGIPPSQEVWICINAVLPHGSWVLTGG